MKNYYFGDIELIVCDDYEKMSKACADYIAETVNNTPGAVLGLATGSSPVGTYKELIALNKAGHVDFSDVTTFNLDEYYPIAEENDQSYHYFMNDNLFNHVNIKKSNTNFPKLDAPDANISASDYEKLICASKRVNLQLVGIGLNGHIGFNEPNDVYPAETHYEKLTESTRQANSRFFKSIDEVPTHAITMGIGTIMRADRIAMVVSGENKAEILYKTLKGDITPRVPSTALRFHRNVKIFADAAAAGLIENGTVV